MHHHAVHFGMWRFHAGEAELRSWLEQAPETAFAADLQAALPSEQPCHSERHSHLSNMSMAFRPAELAALGYEQPVLVLHWIFSLELLPLVGDGTLVCGVDLAWRFGCVPPCLVGSSACDGTVSPSDDCAVAPAVRSSVSS